jgi:putative ABC transport system permease protein
MNIFKLFQIALTALTLNVMRSVLTMLGIIIGVSAVIIMVSIGAGAQQQVDAQIEAMGSNVLIIFGGWNNRGGGGTAAVATLQDKYAQMMLDQVYGLEAATPYVSGRSQMIFGNLNWSADVLGTTNDFFITKNWDLESGRGFTAAEMNSGEKVVIIGTILRDELFGASDPIGQSVRMGTFNATVIGVLEEKGPDARGNDQDDVAVMPLKTVRTNITGISKNNPNSVSYLEVKAGDTVNMAYVTEEVTNLLRQVMNVSATAERDPFRVLDMAETIESRAETQAIFNTLLAAVASVSLVVGGIGIMNIMMVSVTERTREIGLRMAIGAKPDDILNQFLIEAITLCGVGGLIGVGIAFGVTQVMETYFDMVTLINPEIVLISLGFSALIGVFFGYYPALKASRLQPIDALRYE